MLLNGCINLRHLHTIKTIAESIHVGIWKLFTNKCQEKCKDICKHNIIVYYLCKELIMNVLFHFSYMPEHDFHVLLILNQNHYILNTKSPVLILPFLINNFCFIFIYFMCISIFPAGVYEHHVHASSDRGQ